MINLGMVKPGQTLRIPFSTFDKDDGSSITMTNYAVADILIYKDGSTTERASTSGFTATTDFDAKTGKQLIVIDLADNTTAGFYAAGSEYIVAIDAVTVDAVTTGGWVARFEIGYEGAVLNTTIATLASQTSFTLTAGPAEDDALNNCQIVIHDVASAVQVGRAVILDYTGSTKTVTLAAGTTFTAAATDNVAVLGLAPLIPTTAGRTLDVSAGGEAGVDWANVGTPGSTVSLSATTVATVTTTGTATNVTTVNGLAANVITATSIQADAITAAKVASDVSAEIADAVWDEDATGHQTQGTFGQAIGDPVADTNTIFKAVVTDATGATVGVDVAAVLDDTGTAGVVVASLAAGSITAAAIATGAIDADALAADAGTEIGTAVWATATRVLTAGTNIDGSTFTAIPWNAAWDAEVQSEVQDAIEVNHLDHLLAATYDPASKPGAADALLNELVESDAGVARYTANALEQAPTGGSAPTASQIADEVQTRTIAGVTLVATTTNLTNLPTIPANWLTAAGTAADFTTEIQSGLATAANLATVAGYLDTEIAAILEDTGTTIPAQISALNNLSAAQVNAEVDTAIADARLDELLAADSDIDGAAPPTVGSVFHELMTKTAGSFTYDQTTDSLEAVRDRGDAAWTTATGFSTLDAAGVRAAVGLASANLDTQLDALPTNAELATALGTADDATLAQIALVKAKTDLIPADPADQSAVEAAITAATSPLATAANLATVAGYLDTEIAAILADTNELQTDWANGGRLDLLIDAIKAKTDNLPAAPAATGDIPTVSQIWTTALVEAYRSVGAAGTPAQLLHEIIAHLGDSSISGTTKTINNRSGSAAKTYTLNSATTPTSIAEAS